MSGAGIWIIDHDAHGMPAFASIYVLPCAAEPVETLRQHAEDWRIPWSHGLAETLVANGCEDPLPLCWPCARRWYDEAARQARLRALPPSSRAWLADRGVTDWKGQR